MDHYLLGYSKKEEDYWREMKGGVTGLNEKLQGVGRTLDDNLSAINKGIGNSNIVSPYTPESATMGTKDEYEASHDNNQKTEEQAENEFPETDERLIIIQNILTAIKNLSADVMSIDGILDADIATYKTYFEELIESVTSGQVDEDILEDVKTLIVKTLQQSGIESEKIDGVLDVLDKVLEVAKESPADFSQQVISQIIASAGELITADEVSQDQFDSFMAQVNDLLVSSQSLVNYNNAQLVDTLKEYQEQIKKAGALSDSEKDDLNWKMSTLISLIEGMENIDFANEDIGSEITTAIHTFMASLNSNDDTTHDKLGDLLAKFKDVLIQMDEDADNNEKSVNNTQNTIAEVKEDLEARLIQNAEGEDENSAEEKDTTTKAGEGIENQINESEKENEAELTKDTEAIVTRIRVTNEKLSRIKDHVKAIESQLDNVNTSIVASGYGITGAIYDAITTTVQLATANSSGITAYASGVRKTSKDEIALTQEHGGEIVMTKYGMFTPLPKGSGVIPANLTDNLLSMATGNIPNIGGAIRMPDVKSTTNNTQNIHYDALINIEGNVDQNVMDDLNTLADKLLNNSKFNFGMYQNMTNQSKKESRKAGYRR